MRTYNGIQKLIESVTRSPHVINNFCDWHRGRTSVPLHPPFSGHRAVVLAERVVELHACPLALREVGRPHEAQHARLAVADDHAVAHPDVARERHRLQQIAARTAQALAYLRRRRQQRRQRRGGGAGRRAAGGRRRRRPGRPAQLGGAREDAAQSLALEVVDAGDAAVVLAGRRVEHDARPVARRELRLAEERNHARLRARHEDAVADDEVVRRSRGGGRLRTWTCEACRVNEGNIGPVRRWPVNCLLKTEILF